MPRVRGPPCNTRFMCGDCEVCEPRSFATHPYSANWSYQLNDTTPRQCFKTSHLKYWFSCPTCHHDFDATLANVVAGKVCPFCSKPTKKLCDDENCQQCFENSFASHPKAVDWVDERCSPRDEFKYSNKLYSFHCSACRHISQYRLNDFASNNIACGFCCTPTKRLCMDSNCTHCHSRSFASHVMAAKWCPTNKLKPREIFLHCNNKFWFVCTDCNYRFSAAPCGLTQGRSGQCMCRYKTEKKLFEHLKQTLTQMVETQKRYDWCKGLKLTCPFDFVIEDLDLIIELDGRHHHVQNVPNWRPLEEVQARDQHKMECAMANGYSVIRIMQEDVWQDKGDWARKLAGLIKKYDSPMCCTVRTNPPHKVRPAPVVAEDLE